MSKPVKMKRLTVRELRKLLEKVTDDKIPIKITWKEGPPGDSEPGVEVCPFELTETSLNIPVKLFYLEDGGYF